MKRIEEFPVKNAKALRYVLFDIDDTITTDGKLEASAYTALWALHNAGISVIPVTGRPAGWCDMIVRQWPVKGVIGENGAFAYYFEGDQLQTYTHPNAEENASGRLEEIWQSVQKEFPLSRLSKDQFCRKYDLAIDFGEDSPYLGFEVAEEIRALCASFGAEAKVSSIHVNAWFGQYDKVSMSKLFLEEVLGEKDITKHCFFFGDSPNDEPMFAFFPHSCAVANILPFAEGLTNLPTYVTGETSGAGFVEGVSFLLSQYNK